MLRPVRQEWRRVATTDDINEKRSEEGKISSGGWSPAFVDSTSKDSAKKGSAKARLHQLCTMQHWEHPVYECCNSEGPDHQKLFTFKVALNIGEASTILECFGNPRPNKKTAADDAAEGALWCLKHMGYQLDKS